MDETYGRLQLPNGICLEVEWDPEQGQWAMWLEFDGQEVAEDPYRLLGGSGAQN
jgi:hypothetical protein